MKKMHLLFMLCCSVMLLLSCKSKTQKLIAIKWDCVQIENLAPMDKHYVTPEDSIAVAKAEQALQSLVWTFNSDNTYSCSVGNGVTVQGSYSISSDGKSLILIPASQNNINTYIITSISETELTLTNTGTAMPIIMHFRPH
jgi:hypothetical protein